MFKKPNQLTRKISSSKEENKEEDALEKFNDEADQGKHVKVKRFRSRPASDDDSDSDSDTGGGGPNLLQQAKKEQQDQLASKKLKSVSTIAQPIQQVLPQYSSVDSTNLLTQKDYATRSAEYHSKESSKDKDRSNSSLDNNFTTYKGNQEPRNKFLAGPIRASTVVRTTCRFDYQPDICKDYKETGFCGFGDTCIYLHDRGDTKSGWQIEAEYEEKKKREMELREKEMELFLTRFKERAEQGHGVVEEEDFSWKDSRDEKVEDGLPFACFICRGAFREPIVTSCGHYFCQPCILKSVKEKSTACPVCSKDTDGVFNHPSKLMAKKRRVVGSNGTWEQFRNLQRL